MHTQLTTWIVLFAALLVHSTSARHSFQMLEANASTPMVQDIAIQCGRMEKQMTPLCGDKDERTYHAFVCEKQCIDAVKQLLRRQDDTTHPLCLTEWKEINRVQASECPRELSAFMPSAMSVSTIASAILSIFVLFSCS